MNPDPGRTHLAHPVGDSDHIQGLSTAPITLVEYGGYECRHSGAAHAIVQGIQDALGKRLRFVFRNFPLSATHPHAAEAAESAEAAGAQGRFWQMHNLLFENQRELGKRALLRYADRVGLDILRFTRELAERTFEPRIREVFLGGLESGVGGTPTFFINSIRHEDRHDAETLLEAIEDASASNQPR